MSTKRIAILTAIILLSVSAVHVFADGKKKKVTAGKKTTDSTAVRTQLAEYDSTHYRYFLFPQFYSYWPIDNNDTILRYEAFDEAGNPLNMDTLYNVMDVRHIYFVKTHLDYLKTYIDAEGKPKPQPVINRLYTYDRTGINTWTSYDNINKYTGYLQENRNDIVRTDTTVVIDPISNTRSITIRKYYRVIELDSTDNKQGAAQDGGTSSVTSTIYTYLVPEFYFNEVKRHNDTTLEFRCYDSRDSIINNVDDYDSVKYYSVFKSYTDSTHTYKDANGDKQLLPVSSIIKRYDRLGKNRWMSIEYPGNKYQELTEYKNTIVRSDTVQLIDPVTEKSVLKVYNHYKVVKS